MNNLIGTSKLGIIGMGSMGLAISERLLRMGHAVLGFRRSSLEDFVALGGEAQSSSSSLVQKADIILLLLPNEEALLSVLNEIELQLRPGKLLVSLATYPLAIKQKAQRLIENAGARFLEGEVSGTPEMIRSGKASVFLTGLTETDVALQEMLEAGVGPIIQFPNFGDASRVKLIANYLMSVHTLAAADALDIGRRLGIKPSSLLEALLGSAAASAMLAIRGPLIALEDVGQGDLEGFLRYYVLLRDSLEQKGDPASALLNLTENLYRQTVNAGHGAHDLAAVIQTLKNSPNFE